MSRVSCLGSELGGSGIEETLLCMRCAAGGQGWVGWLDWAASPRCSSYRRTDVPTSRQWPAGSSTCQLETAGDTAVPRAAPRRACGSCSVRACRCTVDPWTQGHQVAASCRLQCTDTDVTRVVPACPRRQQAEPNPTRRDETCIRILAGGHTILLWVARSQERKSWRARETEQEVQGSRGTRAGASRESRTTPARPASRHPAVHAVACTLASRQAPVHPGQASGAARPGRHRIGSRSPGLLAHLRLCVLAAMGHRS